MLGRSASRRPTSALVRARTAAFAIVVACISLAIAAATGATGAGAASSSTVVTATIPSAISLTNNCTASSGWDLGIVQPGSIGTTSTGAGVCSFTFSSSNDSAMIRLGQRDAKGTAMASSNSTSLVSDAPSVGPIQISMATTSVGWAEGDDTLYRTADGGVTWTTVTHPGIGVNDVLAVDASTVVAFGSGGAIRRWTDGSGVWTPVASGTTEYIWGATKTSASNLYAVAGGGTILKSTDGGASWSAQVLAGAPDIRSIDGALGTNTVYVVDADNSRLLKTTDGVNWSPTASMGIAIDVSTFDGTTVFAPTAEGGVYASSDGGATWIYRIPPGIGASLRPFYAAVEATAAGTAYVFGPRGALAKTTDSGATWVAQAAATTNEIKDSTSVAGRVWAGGTGRVIVNTTDGTNWTKQRGDATDLFGVSAVNADVAYAVGGEGVIRKTTDGGTWNTQASGVTTDLNAVSAVDATHAFAVGSGGTILATTDGSAWSVQVAGPGADLRGVVAVDRYTAWAVGDSGTILKTSNGGTSWVQQASGTGVRLHAVDAADKDRVYAVGDSGTILKTDDGGATWSAQTSGTTENLTSVAAVTDTDIAWAGGAGSGNVVRYTTDGGATAWTGRSGLSCCTKFALDAMGPNSLFLGEAGCNSSRSRDGGATWQFLDPTFCGIIWGASAVDANIAIFVGAGGGIARTQLDNPVSDYGGGSIWGGAPSANAFGVCVQNVGLTASVALPWVEDTVTTPGSCEAADTDPWAAVPATPTKLATTAGAGQAGQVDLVWAFKAADDQPKGLYTATVVIEAIAPDA